MKGFTQILNLVPEGALYLTASPRDTDRAHAHFRQRGKRVLVYTSWGVTDEVLRGRRFSAVVLAPDVYPEDAKYADLTRVRLE